MAKQLLVHNPGSPRVTVRRALATGASHQLNPFLGLATKDRIWNAREDCVLGQGDARMVTVTYTAGEHMAYLLSEHQVRDDVVLRIKLTKGGVEMQPDKIRPGDETFDHNGKVVLVLDQQTLQLLGNKTIDVMTDDDGSHLILN